MNTYICIIILYSYLSIKEDISAGTGAKLPERPSLPFGPPLSKIIYFITANRLVSKKIN